MATKKDTNKSTIISNALNAISSDRARLVKDGETLFTPCEKATVSGGYEKNPFVVTKAGYEKAEMLALAAGDTLDARFRLITPNETEIIKRWKALNTQHSTLEANAHRIWKAEEKMKAKS